MKVQQNWGGFIILSGYRGSGHKTTAITESQDRNTLKHNKIKETTITAKGEWPHYTGCFQRLEVKLHEMSLWIDVHVCNGSILIPTLATERIKLALILYRWNAIYGSKGWLLSCSKMWKIWVPKSQIGQLFRRGSS